VWEEKQRKKKDGVWTQPRDVSRQLAATLYRKPSHFVLSFEKTGRIARGRRVNSFFVAYDQLVRAPARVIWLSSDLF